jgi:hypothetical protein
LIIDTESDFGNAKKCGQLIGKEVDEISGRAARHVKTGGWMKTLRSSHRSANVSASCARICMTISTAITRQ